MAELKPPTLYIGNFDESEYLKLHPDVANANVDAWLHYKEHGNYEMRKIAVNNHGRIKTGIWNEHGYLQYNTDVGTPSRWNRSGWEHYVNHGHGEGRNIAIQ